MGAAMTTLADVANKKQAEASAEQNAALELVRLAQERASPLRGPDGVLTQLTTTVQAAALNEDMTEHLGHQKHDPPEAGTGTIANHTPATTGLDRHHRRCRDRRVSGRAATFEPQIVKKPRRPLSGGDDVALPLYATGLATGENSAHFAEIYAAPVSKETISRITDEVIEVMNESTVRPPRQTHAAISSTRAW